MANREILALNESTPQIEAAQAGDTYLAPRLVFFDGTLKIKDAAAAAADTAGYGQIWVDNATPDKLMFTDDAGTDFQVATTARAETFTNKTLTSPTIATMLIDDGDAGLTITSADQTNAAPTATIPDIGDAADSFCMIDTAQTLTNKTLTAPAIGTVASGVITACTGSPVLGTPAPEAITATVGGGGTGLITATTRLAVITSDSADKQVSLPAGVGGQVLRLFCAATGCEAISAVAGDKINNVVVGATNEAALVAGTMYTLVYDGTDNWVMTGLTNLGVVETPVVPDSL